MAEPIRKPVHRPRPPHPHTQSRPQTVLVRSRLLPQELDPTPPPPQEISQKAQPAPSPLTLLPRPKVRTAPPPPAPPVESRPDPPPAPPAALAPPEDLTLSQAGVERGRSARKLLLAALALHAGALLAALPGPAGDPTFNLGPAELILAGSVLLSGGLMLVLGRR